MKTGEKQCLIAFWLGWTGLWLAGAASPPPIFGVMYLPVEMRRRASLVTTITWTVIFLMASFVLFLDTHEPHHLFGSAVLAATALFVIVRHIQPQSVMPKPSRPDQDAGAA